MKRLIAVATCLGLVWAFPAFGAGLKVAEGTITTKVVDRAPVDHLQTSPASTGTLYCYTRIAGASGDTTVTQVWYREGQEMARIVLPVRSADWRTWSSKRILPQWTGQWKVEILDSEGHILQTIPFSVVKG
ncbi:MAG: DUF2914 domain-containing protein [Desulfuromonadales bacterium]|jgi:hypothetical protein